MSERLRKAYEEREIKRIEDAVKFINRKFHARMHRAGEEFKKRHPELYAPKDK